MGTSQLWYCKSLAKHLNNGTSWSQGGRKKSQFWYRKLLAGTFATHTENKSEKKHKTNRSFGLESCSQGRSQHTRETNLKKTIKKIQKIEKNAPPKCKKK